MDESPWVAAIRNSLALSLLLSVLFVLTLTDCSSGKLRLHDNFDPKRDPTHEDYFDQYLLGFVGNVAVVDAQKVCHDLKPLALEKVRTAEDIFIGTLTVGIYTPLTLRVWCGR